MALADGKEVATSPEDVVYLIGNVGTRGMGVFDEGKCGCVCVPREREEGASER